MQEIKIIFAMARAIGNAIKWKSTGNAKWVFDYERTEILEK